MRPAIPLVFSDARIRAPALTLVALAFTYAATVPYQSIIGINELGLSSRSYSALVICASFVNVSASVVFGNLSDRIERNKLLMIALCLTGFLGFSSIYIFRSADAFIYATLFLIPVSNCANPLLFRAIRVATAKMEKGDSASVTASARALFSGSWALAPGLVGIYLSTADTMMPAYAVAAVASLAAALLFVLSPSNSGGLARLPVSSESFVKSLGRVLHRRVLIGVGIMSLLGGLQRTSNIIAPLIITHSIGGSVIDVGVNSGFVAFLEMPFMLLYGRLQRRYRRSSVLIVGTCFYIAYLLLLSVVTRTWQIYALLPINACGAAAILSIPITYLQDLIADKPGLGSSLISVNLFLSNGISALVFGLGAAIVGYSDIALIAAALGVVAVLALLVFARQMPASPATARSSG